MTTRHRIALIGLAAGVGLLGGCASLGDAQTRPRYTYLVVPCETPGAIRTGGPAAGPPLGSGVANVSAAPAIAPGAPSAASEAPVCVVAAASPGRYAASRYYPDPFYRGGYYGGPYYGSFGFSYFGGRHHGGHHGGGHRH